MPSQRSNIFEVVACFQESARRGDWKSAGDLASILPQQMLPPSLEGLAEYLRCLNQALIVARVSRAKSTASLARLNAAARFNKTRLGLAPPRQEFGEAADF